MIRKLMLLSFILPTFTAGETTRNLSFMLITSFGEFGFNSSGAIPGVDTALNRIRERQDMLPGYNLVYDKVRDSKCDRTSSLDEFFDGISSGPVKLFIIGCGCSVASEPVAEISHRWNISQVSYGSSSSDLSNRARFKGYFRTSVTHEIIPPAFRAILQHFNWSRVVLFTQKEGLFEAIESNFRKELESANITVESPTFQTKEGPMNMATRFFDENKEDFHVYFLNTYPSAAREIFCEAYNRSLTYPGYAWIVFDWYPKKWWTEEVSNKRINCTDSQLSEFMERVLSLREDPAINLAAETNDTGISPAEYQMEYERRAHEGGYLIEDVGAYAYDAVWAMAFALNATISMINSQEINITSTGCGNAPGMLVPLENFNYSNDQLGCIIRFHLQRTSFAGISGLIRFDHSGTREHDIILLKQYQKQGQLIRRNVAIIEEQLNYTFLYERGINIHNVYPDGAPPDGKPEQIINTLNIGLVVTFDLLATLGIIFTISCLVFNFTFRNKKVVKLSSPNLNYFILTGAFVMYLSIYFYLIPSVKNNIFQAKCVLGDWLFIIGYSLVFGAILSKMWRIFKIFHNPTPNKKLLKDHHLVIFTLVVVGVPVLLLIIEMVVPQLRGEVTSSMDLENPPSKTTTALILLTFRFGAPILLKSLGVRQEYFVLVCYEALSPTFYWRSLTFAYLAVLQVIGLLLAFQTRKVKIKGLRDSKFITAIVYTSSIVVVVLVLVNISLKLFINIGTGILVVGILTLTTLILALAFVSKMVMIYIDEATDSSFETPSFAATTAIKITQIQNESDLQEKVLSLQKSLENKDKLIAELRSDNNALKQVQDSATDQACAHSYEQNNHSNN